MRTLDPLRFEITVASFYDGGGLRSELERVPGVRVVSLAKRGRWDNLPFLWRLLRELRAARPHVVHGYLSGANELVLLAGRLVGARVVWGLRSSMQEGGDDWLAAGIFRCGVWLSHFTDLIIANSYAGRQFHIKQRYAGRRIVVIHNGIDTEHFRPRPEAGCALRRAWGVADDATLVGCVGRFDMQKDFPTFLRAAAALASTHPEARFVCVGGGEADYTRELRRLATDLGLDGRLIWAGTYDNMPAVYSSLDLYVSASRSEGFSNVIAEAMACGVPCVVTDVGDSAMVVGDTGRVVPAGNVQAVSTAIAAVIDKPQAERASLGRRARERIEQRFSLHSLRGQTEQVLREVTLWAV